MSEMPPPFDTFWFRLLIGFIVGGVLGSFITMLSYRLPRDLSILLPPSHCPACDKALKARDLIPLFSWLLAKGVCRYCGVTFGVRYFLIELITSVTTMVAFGYVGFRLEIIPVLLLILTIITLLTVILEKAEK